MTGPSSAFEKWSGHVVVLKGSRKGVFGYFPGEKFGFMISLDAILLNLGTIFD